LLPCYIFMKIFIKYLKSFLKEDFRLTTYLPVLVYLACFISINYTFHFEHRTLDKYVGTVSGFIYYFIFYGTAYFPVAVYVLLMNGKNDVLKNKWFWIRAGFIIALLAGSAFFSFYRQIIDIFQSPGEKYLIRKILYNSRNVFMILIPLVLFWYFLKPHKSGFLWIRFKKLNLVPYFMILLCIMPLIFTASFGFDFQVTYPTFKPWNTQPAFGMERWQSAGIYEIFYGLDFITVEMLFRGALVVGMVKLLGKECILPMISVYCFLHFGKPMGEAISSIFGGYILGIIAFNTESIVGGALVHMGVAWMMEIFAYFQHYL